MKLRSVGLEGAWLVGMNRHEDTRGWFGRLHCDREFAALGLPERFVQSNISHNRRSGTVRGLHWQWPPSQEGKLIRCIRGRIFDAFVDLRPDSPTFTQHASVELDADSADSVFIPAGFAHGFQVLADDTEVLYLMSDFYAPELSAGFRFDDPAFAVRWPAAITDMSERDAQAPTFQRSAFVTEYRSRLASPQGGPGRERI